MILTPEQPTLALHARNAAESAHPELWRGLVGAWVPALGYQGDILHDLSGNGNNGTIISSLWRAHDTGHALELDGIDDYVDLPVAAVNEAASDSLFSYVIYFEAKNTSDRQIVMAATDQNGFGDSNTILEMNIGRSSGEGEVLVKRDDFSIVTQITTGWQAWVCAVTPNGFKFYINGTLVGESTGNVFGSTTQFRIGRPADNVRYLDGSVGMAGLYNRALTGVEAASLSTDPLAPFRLRDDTALATAVMFGGTPSVTLPPPLLNMQMTGSF